MIKYSNYITPLITIEGVKDMGFELMEPNNPHSDVNPVYCKRTRSGRVCCWFSNGDIIMVYIQSVERRGIDGKPMVYSEPYTLFKLKEMFELICLMNLIDELFI